MQTSRGMCSGRLWISPRPRPRPRWWWCTSPGRRVEGHRRGVRGPVGVRLAAALRITPGAGGRLTLRRPDPDHALVAVAYGEQSLELNFRWGSYRVARSWEMPRRVHPLKALGAGHASASGGRFPRGCRTGATGGRKGRKCRWLLRPSLLVRVTGMSRFHHATSSKRSKSALDRRVGPLVGREQRHPPVPTGTPGGTTNDLYRTTNRRRDAVRRSPAPSGRRAENYRSGHATEPTAARARLNGIRRVPGTATSGNGQSAIGGQLGSASQPVNAGRTYSADRVGKRGRFSKTGHTNDANQRGPGAETGRADSASRISEDKRLTKHHHADSTNQVGEGGWLVGAGRACSAGRIG